MDVTAHEYDQMYQHIHAMRFAATLHAISHRPTLPLWPWALLLFRLKLEDRPHQKAETRAHIVCSVAEETFVITYVVERMRVRLYNGHETYYNSFFLRVTQTEVTPPRSWFKQCCVTSCGHMMGEHDTANEDVIGDHFVMEPFSICRVQRWTV